MNHSESYTDERIDQILRALATTAPPSGLEQRISARIAQRAAKTLESEPSFFARIVHAKLQPFAIATAALIALAATCLLFITPTRQQQIVQQQSPAALPQQPAQFAATAQTTTHHNATLSQRLQEVVSPATMQPAQEDSDAIALAETFAPSRPTPPLPLTSQETLLLRSTRQGQPIEIAELETLRDSALTAIAAAHERSSLREYVHSLLGPLATAQTLTPSSPPSNDAQPVADTEPSSSK